MRMRNNMPVFESFISDLYHEYPDYDMNHLVLHENIYMLSLSGNHNSISVLPIIRKAEDIGLDLKEIKIYDIQGYISVDVILTEHYL